MLNIPLSELLAKMPVAEIERTIKEFLAPIIQLLPEKRLQRVAIEAVRGILAQETPVIAAMAQSTPRQESSCYGAAKRLYRFIWNKRFNHRHLFKGLYRIAQQTVAQANPAYLVVVIDPVNFEKAYTEASEGVSTVYKSTPPDLHGKARLTRGYPAITATVVNTPIPAISYANWFSYQTSDFVSENREIQRAIRTTRWVFAGRKLRFVMDSGGDDQKLFAALASDEFIIAAKHLDRRVEVYNERLDRWENEALQDLVACVPWQVSYEVAFRHAGVTRLTHLRLGWFRVRLPQTHQPLWVLVAEDDLHPTPVTLLTNIPLLNITTAQQVYADWRLRGRIEHGYRFDQEQGLDVEDMRVRTLERMRRIFALVLAVAQLVFFIAEHWPEEAVLWLRKLGGKLGLKSDRDRPYILLRGLSAVLQTLATLSWLAI